MSAHLQDELLTAALDGTLSAADREAVDAHLEVCARCRGDLELSRGARTALRSLPDEIRPPIDVAAAVAAEIAGGGGASAGSPTGPPRWYRAAGLVAAAAAIVLGVMILPRVTGDEQQDRSNVTEAVGAEAGSAPEAGATAPSIKAALAVEKEATDYDEAGLRGLLENSDLTPAASATAADSVAQLTSGGRVALDCVRAAAGDWIPDDAEIVRLIDAKFEGTLATIGVFSVPSGGGGVVAVTRDHCGLLASVVS
jgi:anti-sigma factor RsiW